MMPVTTRVPADIHKALGIAATFKNVKPSELARMLLEEGLRRYALEAAEELRVEQARQLALLGEMEHLFETLEPSELLSPQDA